MSQAAASHAPGKAQAPLRFITAASLFDGHDASINIMRRMLQASGVEVVHLGHNRSVAEIVSAAIQEDTQGIAISSYQGGHVEYFKYMIDCLRERGADQIQVFGGGGGVIIPEEIDLLHNYGVARIYSPQDGQLLGLQGMIDHMIDHTRVAVSKTAKVSQSDSTYNELFSAANELFSVEAHRPLARLISAIEDDELSTSALERLHAQAAKLDIRAPVLGITGTGGSGKSSVTDELIRRLRLDQSDTISVALLAIDPTRRKTGGALLGDRIRMNAIAHPGIFMRSIATRDASGEVPDALPSMVAACRLSGVDLVIVETPGIGQGDAGIVDISDLSLYVMTPEFGAASQLEKIDMLDFADIVAINKLERKGGLDALRDVRKQVQRNHELFDQSPDQMPVFGTIAARFNDDGVTALYQAVASELVKLGLKMKPGCLPLVDTRESTQQSTVIPLSAQRYLSEIADCIRQYHIHTQAQADVARQIQHLMTTQELLGEHSIASSSEQYDSESQNSRPVNTELNSLLEERQSKLSNRSQHLLRDWPNTVDAYRLCRAHVYRKSPCPAIQITVTC